MIPRSCLTSGSHDTVNCDSIFTTSPVHLPASYKGVNYIQTSNLVYFQMLHSTAVLTYNGVKKDIGLEPISIQKEYFPVYIKLPSASQTFSIDYTTLTSDVTESLDILLTLNHRVVMSQFSADIKAAPSLPIKLDEMKNIFSNLQQLHDASPAVRALIWSSVAGLLLLVGAIIAILWCLCCPNCCCTSSSSGRHTPCDTSSPTAPSWSELQQLSQDNVD